MGYTNAMFSLFAGHKDVIEQSGLSFLIDKN
jgi:hypothetical protein